jgi:hydroxyacylglutathione hydrolase
LRRDYSELMALQIYEHLIVGPLACNCYLVGDPGTRKAIVIDPGDDAELITESVVRHGLEVVGLVATHAHFDHVMGADTLRATYGVPFYMHEQDRELLRWLPESLQLFLGCSGTAPAVDRLLKDGDELMAGACPLEVVHTPGHSPGSICLIEPEGALFSGDTLFAESVGRADLPGGDLDAMVASIRQRLFTLEDRAVYPGHGPPTSLEHEKRYNPFVGRGGVYSG